MPRAKNKFFKKPDADIIPFVFITRATLLTSHVFRRPAKMDAAKPPAMQEVFAEDRPVETKFSNFAAVTTTEDFVLTDLFLAYHPGTKTADPKAKEALTQEFFREALRPKRAKSEKRQEDGQGLTVREQARKQGQTVYYVVTVGETGMKFQWKDSTGAVVNSKLVKLKEGLDYSKAEYHAKRAHDVYWENSIKAFNCALIVKVGRLRLKEFAKTGSKGKDGFPPIILEEHALTGLMQRRLAREEDAANIAKLLQHLQWQQEGK
ncbi:hypothetical protein F53441_177 [Fusarium austroafricanum]|uniref:Uncharacterized protein n=1 Tax=Fusarium austroafricanum TaxID=2364996 RepID=A0A8H4KZ11_9HYPO|nr:hypothetical protein F53441_177 [Fusarium austroafricanum]